jgi:rod shape-determining protein MreD
VAILSMRSRKRAWDLALAGLTVWLAWLLQTNVLNNMSFQETICNLPLALTILWGFVFGSSLPALRPDEVKLASAGEVFFRQLLGGSVSGALLGAFVAALYASSAPIYPFAFPAIGWIAGYFSVPRLNQETLICIPVVLLGTVMAEMLIALQLQILGFSQPFQHLSHIALPEALLNALIAPFIYFPMKSWHDFAQAQEVTP